MFLKECSTGHLIEVLDEQALFDPTNPRFQGRLNIGEELPESELFDKQGICFPSGEALPRCWISLHYRDNELKR